MSSGRHINSFLPGIIINITDRCNFKCQYCPPYGENLNNGVKTYDEEAIILVIRLAKKYGIKQIRLTGGEPFLEPPRIRRFLDECENAFERLVINTNGSMLEENFSWLKKYKDQIVLKISLDTLEENKFKLITQKDSFSTVYKNLLLAISYGFNLELNVVLYNQTFEEICELIEFVISNQINLKFLTTSTFYGNIKYEQLEVDMKKIVDYLEKKSKYISNDKLVGERGTSMIVYHINKSKITIFDSRSKDSLTPLKCYFSYCEDNCFQYPCDHGAFSISISTDGIMSICRGKKELGKNIFGCSINEIEDIFINQIKQFESCFSINVNLIGR